MTSEEKKAFNNGFILGITRGDNISVGQSGEDIEELSFRAFSKNKMDDITYLIEEVIFEE